MNEEVNLSDIVEVSSGLTLSRFKSKDDENVPETMSYYHITLKSVEDNKIDLNMLDAIKTDRGVDKHYLLKKGDIIIKLSPPYSAAMINFDLNNLLAANNFAILRSKGEYDPEYLTHILNGSHVRNQMNRLVQGTTLPVIQKSSLNQIKIRKREMKEQIKYAKLLSLLFKRKELKIRTIELEEKLRENILYNI